MRTGEEISAQIKRLIAEQRYQEAVRLCRRALLSKPDSVSIRLLLGVALLALRRYEDVHAEMTAVLRQAPKEAAAYRLLGEAFLHAGRPERAKEPLKQAISLAPGDPAAEQLLRDADAETDVGGSTLDRWMGDEAAMELPTEEHQTGRVREPEVPRPPALPPRSAPPRRESAALPSRPPRASDPPADFDDVTIARAENHALPRPSAAARASVRVSSTPPEPDTRPRSAPPPIPPRRRSSLPAPRASVPPQRASVPPQPASVPPQPASVPPQRASTPPPPALGAGANVFAGRTVAGIGAPKLPSGVGAALPGSHAPRTSAPPRPSRASLPPAGLLDGRHVTTASGRPAPGAASDYPELRISHPRVGGQSSRPPADRPAPPRDAADGVNPLWTVARSESGRVLTEGASGRQASRPPRARLAPRAVLLGVAVTALVLLALGAAWLVVRGRGARDPLADEVRDALRDGRRATIEAALLSVKKAHRVPGDPAIAAVLHAAAFVEYGFGTEAELATLVDSMGAEAEVAPARAVAGSYLWLARGEPMKAAALLEGAAFASDPEAILARAYALADAGDLAGALSAARAVPTEAAPRALATRVRLEALAGNPKEALRLVERRAELETHPALRVAKALALEAAGDAAGRAALEAKVALDRMAAEATGGDLAWADLVLARDALVRGDRGAAQSLIRSATQRNVRADAPLFLALSEAALDAGLPGEALVALERAPKAATARPRGLSVRVRVDLAAGRVDHAAQVLSETSDDAPELWVLRGDVARRKGDLAAAREAYERARGAPSSRAAATRGLIATAFDAREPRRVLKLAAELGDADRTESVLAAVIRAHLELKSPGEARRVLSEGLASHPHSLALRRARAEIALSAEDFASAVTDAKAIVEAAPKDPENQRLLAKASWYAGAVGDAEAAYREVLVTIPEDPEARAGLARAVLRAYDVEAAQPLLAGLEGRPEAEVRLARGELLVLTGGGLAAVELLEPFAKGTKDRRLLAALGYAHVQAEEYRKAQKVFERLVALDARDPDGHLGLALVATRSTTLAQVERLLNVAAAEQKTRKLGPLFEARILAARGRLAYELGNLNKAQSDGRAALERFSRAGEAHHVLADVALDRRGRPEAHLKDAENALYVPPEAIAQLALRTTGDRQCDLVRRYLAAAPDGFDAPRVRPLAQRCARRK